MPARLGSGLGVDVVKRKTGHLANIADILTHSCGADKNNHKFKCYIDLHRNQT